MRQPPRPTPEQPGKQAEREARLARALRANLQRRKEQARRRDAAAGPEEAPVGTAASEEPPA